MNEQELANIAKKCRVTVHGGRDFYDEKPVLGKINRPILSIEFPNKMVFHFKITSVDTDHSQKAHFLKKNFYILKDSQAVQLTQTYHKRMKPNTIDRVDLNHAVRLLNDDTPPLTLCDHRCKTWYKQSRFEVSERDKLGIVKQVLEHKNEIRTPTCPESEYLDFEQKYNQTHTRKPMPNVVPKFQLKLDQLLAQNSEEQLE